jgi:ATP-dependent Clp protease ATP-binding subunit ClpC
MAQVFSDQLRAAPTTRGLAALWLRILADYLRTVPARYLERPSPRGFEMWTFSARRSVFYARHQASSFGCSEITSEHLLLGILREDPKVLPELTAGKADLVRALEAVETNPRRTPPMEDLRVSFSVRHILELAKQEAALSRAHNVTSRHLLAAILQKDDTLAAQVLRRHGINIERLRRED